MDLDRGRELPDFREPVGHLVAVVVPGVGHVCQQIARCAEEVQTRLPPGIRLPIAAVLAGLADIPQVDRDLRGTGAEHGSAGRDHGDINGNIRHVLIFARRMLLRTFCSPEADAASAGVE